MDMQGRESGNRGRAGIGAEQGAKQGVDSNRQGSSSAPQDKDIGSRQASRKGTLNQAASEDPSSWRASGAQASTSSPAGALASQGDTYTEQVATRDVLDRAKITDAIVKLLTRCTDTAPFALGLFGHWGSGKSSQIHFVKTALGKQETPSFRIVDFNAWEHEHSDNIGAALAQAVVEKFVAEMGLVQRLGLARSLALLRNRGLATAMGKDRAGPRIVLTRLALLGTPLLIAFAVFIAAYRFFPQAFKLPGGLAASLTSLGVTWVAAKLYVSENLTNWFKQINANAERIRKVFWFPDFAAKLGSFHEIHLALKQLCSLRLSGGAAPARGDYLLIVVDDLDRCAPHVVKQVFDAVRLVANIPRVVTLVALDERIAFAAVEKHFAQFDGSGREPRQVARDYLAKVFQVAVSLQPASKQASESFIRTMLFAQPGTNSPPPPLPPHDSDQWAKVLPEEIDEFARLAQDTGMVNPRQLWRLKQAWFLLRGLVLKDGDGFDTMRPWLGSLFCREWLLQSSAQVRNQVESAIRSGAAPDGLPRLPEAVRALLASETRNWQEMWAVVDTLLLPAGACPGKTADEPAIA